ncbi:MAG TPA: helix-turn-helix transcriptional regulator, partial [Thermodesulfobacteriota bacterium]|nr:helix-turn-helix transcriptional regulator [Thermodesulfobacteriota bacterium]
MGGTVSAAVVAAGSPFACGLAHGERLAPLVRRNLAAFARAAGALGLDARRLAAEAERAAARWPDR